ncbi:hypothetical protein D3C73_434560 [compost metagenome]
MAFKQVLTDPSCAAVRIQPFITGQAIALLQIFQQFSDQYGRIALAVVLNGTANKADVQLLLGREDRLQEQIAVIVTAAAIAPLNLLRHQVKTQRRQSARVDTVVHAQQADHLERNGTHGHQGTEVDLTGQETLTDALLIEPCGQFIAQQRQRNGIGIARRQAKAGHFLPLLFDQRQRLFGFAVRLKEAIKQLAAQRQPFG